MNARAARKTARADDPQTAEEWQEAVNLAEFLLSIDSCRQYGLIEGGPEVNVERACDILRRGRWRGAFPLPLEQLVELYFDPATTPRSGTAPVAR